MYQSEDMFDLEQHQHFLDMDLASFLTSSESDIGMRNGNEDSGNENMEAPPSGEDEGPNGQKRPKRKSYTRHTQQQIQEMEAFFKECPHPDDRQRKELGRVLGLRPMQIKFWFQNKRTQAKTQREHHLNDLLRAENERLRAENTMYKEALGNASCISCGGPASVGEMSFEEQHLRHENARLREEIQKMSGASSSNYVGNPVVSYSQNQMPSSSLDVAAGGTSSNYGSQSGMVGQMYYGSSSGGTRSDLPRSHLAPPSANSDKQMIVELAVAAMDELTRLALMGAPLWIPCGNSEILNVDEYTRSFPGGIGPKPFGFRTEASRDSVIVLMNPINLIEILMDVNQWSAMFSGIVPSGMTVEVLSTGLAGNYNGALQVMSAEFQIPSPLVPTRDNYFVRYCKQHQEGTWAVVDVSLDHPRPSTTSLRSRRRPSGCLIQELPNGYSKVTWVEHVEVDDTVVVMHNHYKPLITSCLAFGAKRWLASLERQCERLASSMAINIPPGDLCLIMSPEGRKSMLKLAERMIMSFCTGVGTSKAHAWIPVDPVDGDDDLKVMTRKSTNEPGTPPGILLSAATSFWLPITPKRVFDFIRNENSRTEWDILSNGGEVQEMAHIANGRDPANCVSLFRVNSANCNQNNMLILQESCTDSSGSYVVYAPIDIGAMNLVLGGGDPSPVPLIPSGFAILPDGPAGLNGGEPIPDIIGSGGTMLTVAFQILIDSSPSSKLSQASVTTVSALINRTVQRIKAAVVAPNTTT